MRPRDARGQVAACSPLRRPPSPEAACREGISRSRLRTPRVSLQDGEDWRRRVALPDTEIRRTRERRAESPGLLDAAGGAAQAPPRHRAGTAAHEQGSLALLRHAARGPHPTTATPSSSAATHTPARIRREPTSPKSRAGSASITSTCGPTPAPTARPTSQHGSSLSLKFEEEERRRGVRRTG
jgi:hypothetical protein